jgi:hypothetical protein
MDHESIATNLIGERYHSLFIKISDLKAHHFFEIRSSFQKTNEGAANLMIIYHYGNNENILSPQAFHGYPNDMGNDGQKIREECEYKSGSPSSEMSMRHWNDIVNHL